jgi:hypothetical protein
MAPLTPTERALSLAEIWYPAILLMAFIVSAAVHSVMTARTDEELVKPTALGPGGKPLPLSKRKKPSKRHRLVMDIQLSTPVRRVFQYLHAAVALTFAVDLFNVTRHALQGRDGISISGWWCGEERIVRQLPISEPSLTAKPPQTNLSFLPRYFRYISSARSSSTSTSS